MGRARARANPPHVLGPLGPPGPWTDGPADPGVQPLPPTLHDCALYEFVKGRTLEALGQLGGMSNWRPKGRAGLGPQIDIAREWPAKPASQPVSQKGRIEAFQKLEMRNFKTRKSCPWSGILLFIVTPLAK